MKNKNKVLIGMLSMTAVSVGLFTFQNFVMDKDVSETIIFVAKDDIPAKSELNESMFTQVKVPTDGVLTSYVTNKNDIVGKRLSGAIIKDEPLTKGRLTTEQDLTHPIEIKLSADMEYDNAYPVENNDYIQVYVVLESATGKVDVQKIFDRKQVSVKKASEESSTVSSYYTIDVNEEEVQKFYSAREMGKIIITKNNELDGANGVKAEEFNPESEDAQNSVKEEDKKEDSVLIVDFAEGDTLDNLAVKYKTNVEKIKELNEGKSDFKVGDKITVPAN